MRDKTNYQEMRFDPHPTQQMVDACCARIVVLEAENERLDSWDGMMEVAARHYPMDVDYFASSPDPGCRNIRSLNAINDERKRAEQAEAELANLNARLAYPTVDCDEYVFKDGRCYQYEQDTICPREPRCHDVRPLGR